MISLSAAMIAAAGARGRNDENLRQSPFGTPIAMKFPVGWSPRLAAFTFGRFA